MRVALAQINPTVGDLSRNTQKIGDFIEQARQADADIVAFPELALCGYPPEDLLLKEHFIKDNLKQINLLKQNITGIIAIVGFVDLDKKGNLYNAAAVIQNKCIKGIYRKIELPNYGVFDEKRYFQSGSIAYIFAIGDVKFAVNICEDIWNPKGVALRQAQMGAAIIINLSASPYHTGKGALRIKMLKERARQTKATICYTNLIGGQDELVFDGGSLIISLKGTIEAGAKQFEEDLLVADIPINKKSKTKTKHCIMLEAFEDKKKSCLLKRPIMPIDATLQIYSALVLGTRDYVKKNGFSKVVVGLSGGIDSSLVAAVACDAIGKDNVVGVSMPSPYSSEATKSDARRIANNLGIKFIEIPIENIFNVYLETLQKEFLGKDCDVTEENLQARIRGNILMALSNKFGWLVFNTGNKSETSVGYCTLYGDMAGGFAVIKDVPKTYVYELAEVVNRIHKKNVIPESVMKRAPTAELHPGQKDSDSLPEYPILDAVLKKYVEENKSMPQIVSATKIKRETIDEVVRKVDSNEYKRRQAPPGIKITPKAFGRDRRMPITNLYKG